MDPSKLQSSPQEYASRTSANKYTHAKDTQRPKKKETAKPVFSAYASDPDEYDDMSEMMDLGFD